LTVTGYVVWSDVKGEFFRHGIQFEVSEVKQQFLTKLLNNFAIQIRNDGIPRNEDYTEDSTL